MKQHTICNLNFHTSVGGTQHTLNTALTILNRHFNVKVIDPMNNADFRALLARSDLQAITLHDLSRFPQISYRRGWRRILDGSHQIPAYTQVALRLRRYISELPADVLYVNQTKSALLALLASPRHIPIIYHCHGLAASGIRTVLRHQNRFACIIANSPYTAVELIAAGVAEKRISTVTNTPCQTTVREQAQQIPSDLEAVSSKSPIVLVAHAGIEPNKGTHLVVSAIEALSQKRFPGELWITGEEPLGHASYVAGIRSQIATAGITDRVRFLGRRRDIYAVMNLADIVIVPSLVNESYGRVAAEAMILGKAVIVSNRGNLPNLIHEGTTGLSFDPERENDLVEKLASLINDSGLRRRLGMNAMFHADSNFLLSKYESDLVGAFDATIHSRRAVI